MADFDPYLKWLGIREVSRPINHYRLLGLDLFEDDADVIAMAADRQMSHIRTYQGGPNGDLSQQILNELARARRCLLMAEKKHEYDKELRLAQSAAVPLAAVVVPPPIPSALGQPVPGAARAVPAPVGPSSQDLKSPVSLSEEVEAFDIEAAAYSLADAKKKEFKKLLLMGFAWLSGGVAAVGVAAALISSGVLGTPQAGEPSGKDGGHELPVVDTSLPRSPELPLGRVEGIPMVESAGESVGSNDVEAVSNVVQPSSQSSQSSSVVESALPGYTLDNLTSYPKQVPSLMGVFGEAKRCIIEKKISMLGPPPVSSDEVIEVIPDGGAIVIGLSLATDEKGGIFSILPVYHTGFRAFAGDSFGRGGVDTSASASEKSVLFLAKPGYALSGIELLGSDPFQGCRVNFMKILGNALDPKDTYFNEWVGTESKVRQLVENPQGLPVVGLSVSFASSGSLSRLSLFAMDESAEPVPKNSGASLAGNELPGFFEEEPEMLGADRPDAKPIGEEVAEPVIKLPRPDSRTRAKARKKIAGLLQSIENGAITASTRRSAARDLIDSAFTEEDFVIRYVLWMQAVELGEGAGDATAVVDAMRLVDRYYEIDFWKETLDSIELAARNSSSQTARDFKRTIDDLIQDAEGQGLYDVAVKYLSFAIRQSKKVRDGESEDEYRAIEKRVKKLRDLVTGNEKALAILAINPEDPQASLCHGDFVFVIEGDFESAVPYWRNSGEVDLLAMLDLHAELGRKSREEIIPLADALAKLGESARGLRDRKFLDRALAIYKKSVRSLTGLEKQSINQKIDEIKNKLETK